MKLGKLSQWVKECIEGCRSRGEISASNNGQVLLEKFANKMDEGYEGNVTIPQGGKLLVEEGAEVEGLSTGGSSDDVYCIRDITDYDTQTQTIEGTLAEALAAYENGKKLQYYQIERYNGAEAVFSKSFEFACFPDQVVFFCIIKPFDNEGFNIMQRILTKDGISGSADTYLNSLYVFGRGMFFLRSSTTGSAKYFRVAVDDSGTISATEVSL